MAVELIYLRDKCLHVCLYRYGISFEGCQHHSRKLVHRADHLRGASGVQGKSHNHSNMKHLWMNEKRQINKQNKFNW